MKSLRTKTCFLCSKKFKTGSTDPGGGSASASGGRKSVVTNGGSGLNILLNYLLGTENGNSKNDCVRKDIVEIIYDGDAGSSGGDNNMITRSANICAKCDSYTKRIVELHQELEVVQMKIIQVVKTVKSLILHDFASVNSGGEEQSSVSVQTSINGRQLEGLVFEGVEERQKCLEDEGQTRKCPNNRWAEIVNRFQFAVYENGKRAVEVPYVILNKYTPMTTSGGNLKSESSQPSLGDLVENTIIKIENEEIEDVDSFSDHYDNGGGDDTEHYSCDINNSPCSPTPGPIINKIKLPKFKLKRKTRLTTTKPTTTPPSPDPKIEIKHEEHDREPKQRRLAASLATCRIKTRKRKYARRDKDIILKSKLKRANVEKALREAGWEKGKDRVCQICSYTTGQNVPYKFEQHLRIHEKELQTKVDTKPDFACSQCSKTFYSKQYYAFHIAGHHQRKSLISCDFCNEKVPFSDIQQHMKSHTGLEKIFYCSNCSFCCATRDKYLSHLAYHRKGRLECDICSKVFGTRGTLLRHYFKEHQAVSKFVCEAEGCDKTFYDKYMLNVHRNIHKKDPIECLQCGKVFTHAYLLKTHQQVVHLGEKPFRCPECEESFTSGAALSRHRIRSHEATKYKCADCDKEYMDETSLKTHRTIHDGTGIPCGICDKVMGNKVLWRRHQIVHTTEQNFICEDCGKGFRSQQALTRHSKLHTSEKTFKCQYCAKAFAVSKYLAEHERIHTGEKPFTCDMCGKGFTQCGSLSLHKRKSCGKRQISSQLQTTSFDGHTDETAWPCMDS